MNCLSPGWEQQMPRQHLKMVREVARIEFQFWLSRHTAPFPIEIKNAFGKLLRIIQEDIRKCRFEGVLETKIGGAICGATFSKTPSKNSVPENLALRK